MTAGSRPSRIAWQNVVSCGWVIPSRKNGSDGLDDLQVLGRAVEPAEERDAACAATARRAQQVGDPLLGVERVGRPRSPSALQM